MLKKPKGWYKEIVIRPVVRVDGYESYEKMCGHVADVYFFVSEENIQEKLKANHKDSRYITLYTLLKVGQAKCPAYWVGEDILTALMQSNLDVDATELNWAMKTGFFMLPKGVITSPEKYSVDAIFWHLDTTKNYLYWAVTDGDSFYCRRLNIGGEERKFKYVDVQDFDAETVADFNEYLQAIFLRLLLIMECRTELVDTETQIVKVNKGFGKNQAQDFYQPLWVGRNYRVKRENQQGETGAGTGSSKSIHWRSGFLRNQPYGEGREQRKLIWIEPVMVMGRGEKVSSNVEDKTST